MAEAALLPDHASRKRVASLLAAFTSPVTMLAISMSLQTHQAAMGPDLSLSTGQSSFSLSGISSASSRATLTR